MTVTFNEFAWLVHIGLQILYIFEIINFVTSRIKNRAFFAKLKEAGISLSDAVFADSTNKYAAQLVMVHLFLYTIVTRVVDLQLVILAVGGAACGTMNSAVKELKKALPKQDEGRPSESRSRGFDVPPQDE